MLHTLVAKNYQCRDHSFAMHKRNCHRLFIASYRIPTASPGQLHLNDALWQKTHFYSRPDSQDKIIVSGDSKTLAKITQTSINSRSNKTGRVSNSHLI